MLLRDAYALTLRLLRKNKGFKQQDVSAGVDASYVSRLERGERAVTIEANDSVARGLQVAPLTLLALAHGAQRGGSAKEVLEEAVRELRELDLFDVQLDAEQAELTHPQAAKGIETTKAVLALKAKGLNQLEVARVLNLSTSTVGRHWRRKSH
ncbi:helix-turn-helix transcriptional regulator [Pseudomonas sp. PA27(2017)]|uniref:helix-turn-helix domain-containing protein n=1 Tax=Pseudomonas sp. PA27(2017) TaxID=1932112 RepID=UPI00095C09B1|nr:helix-turn-helix transcriptional regulator [Pseudomonas sp. PA27(2017)]OLU30656.1 hypothetical protein BVH06_15620 [Pseudomonas sp. PA27(2017)]